MFPLGQLALFAAIFTTAYTQDQDQLIHVHVIWRDGDHVPERVCPNDTNKWNEPPGTLTARGMHQQMILGQYIYSKYALGKALIDRRFNPKQIYVRSIDVNRTITGATSNMVGMYYNRATNQPNVDYPITQGWPQGYVPVPVHMIEKSIDYVCNPDVDCHEENVLLYNLTGSSEYLKFLNDERDAVTSIRQKCGQVNFDLLKSDYILDANQVEKLQGKAPLLSDHEEDVLRNVNYFKNGLLSTAVSEQLAALRGGQLLWEIIDHMDHKVLCTQNPSDPSCVWMRNQQLYMYSLTQPGVDALLAALHPTSPAPLDASSDGFALFFELYQSVYGPSVQINYVRINQTTEEIITPYIKACSGGESKCPLNTLKNNAATPRVRNIAQVCSPAPASRPWWLWQRRSTSRRQTPQQGQTTTERLVLVQTIWRHGDRNPKAVCRNDNNTDPTWPLGFDQLSQIGMEQHRQLGAMIYDEYVTKQNFLSESYDPTEVYVRASDLNRTIVSGMANMIGLYYNKSVPAGAVPVNESWPQGFIPFAIHTVDDSVDYITDPHADCPRKSDLVDITMQTPYIQQVIWENAGFINHLSDVCGQELDLLSLSMPVDTQEVELAHGRTTIFTADDYARMLSLSNVGEDVWIGLTNTTTYGGYDLRVELATLTGGPLLFDMIDRMDLKTHCLDPSNAEKSECAWIGPLKYYAYSARGTTVNSFLAALEAKEVFPDGIPNYAAAITVELWLNAVGQYEVAVKFRAGPNSTDFVDITANVDGCPSTGRCSFSSFKYRSQRFNPGDIKESCAKRAYLSTTYPPSTHPSSGYSLLSEFSFRWTISTALLLSALLRP